MLWKIIGKYLEIKYVRYEFDSHCECGAKGDAVRVLSKMKWNENENYLPI